MNDDIILQTINLHKFYIDDNDTDFKNRTNILTDINISIKKQQSLAIIGPSGCGKSTLLNIMGGLENASSGKVEFLGESWGGLDNIQGLKRNKHMGFVYQFHHLIWELNTLENTLLPAWIGNKNIDKSSKNKAEYLLNTLGLSNRIQHYPAQLSGGERQRVAIARSLMNNPLCILADEPTGNLDKQNAYIVFELLKKNCIEHNASLIIVTHDMDIANSCDDILNLKN